MNDAIEPVVPICETCGTKCGGYLLSNAPCPRKQDRGCLLLKNPQYRLVEAGPTDFCATRNATLSVAHNEAGSIQNRGGKVTCSFRNEPNLARFSEEIGRDGPVGAYRLNGGELK